MPVGLSCDLGQRVSSAGVPYEHVTLLRIQPLQEARRLCADLRGRSFGCEGLSAPQELWVAVAKLPSYVS